MGQIIIKNNKFLFRIMDFVILALSFFIAYEQFKNSIFLDTSIVVLTAIYATTAFVLVRISKKMITKLLKSSSDILKMACGNACGLTVSVVLFTILAFIVPSFGDLLPLAIISSLASFFIMGTLVPATKRIIEVKAQQESFRAAL